MITLRPYQMEALTAVEAALQKDKYVLLQAATGAGKTIMFSELIKKYMTAYNMRIGVLAHRRELITQAREKLLKVWPESFPQIGLACQSLGEVKTNRPIVIGSVQTLARRTLSKPINLLIIDEVHRLPPKNYKSQYGELLATLEKAYPDLRILGVTATPYRLGHGYIFGNKCKAKNDNYFEKLDYQISLKSLTDNGYLVPIRAKEAVDIADELKTVTLSGGDYNLGQLDNLMAKSRQLESALKALEEHGEGRAHVLVFAVSIKHAEKLADIFNAHDHPAAALHSKMSNRNRENILQKFEDGRLKILVNVGVLTEGWDSPKVDLILLCRPTMSPALFVQMVGRGTRTSKNKDDLLVLDLAANYVRHGDPANPKVTWPQGEGGEAPMKPCPRCKIFIHISKMFCPACGFNFPVPETPELNESLQMREINKRPPGQCEILNWEAKEYESLRGNLMLRLELKCRPGGLIYHYLDLEGRAHPYAQQKSQKWWHKMSGGKAPPQTIAEALSRLGELRIPEQIKLVKQDNKYKKVQGW